MPKNEDEGEQKCQNFSTHHRISRNQFELNERTPSLCSGGETHYQALRTHPQVSVNVKDRANLFLVVCDEEMADIQSESREE